MRVKEKYILWTNILKKTALSSLRFSEDSYFEWKEMGNVVDWQSAFGVKTSVRPKRKKEVLVLTTCISEQLPSWPSSPHSTLGSWRSGMPYLMFISLSSWVQRMPQPTLPPISLNPAMETVSSKDGQLQLSGPGCRHSPARMDNLRSVWLLDTL